MIAEAVAHGGPHQLQHLLSRAVWVDQQMLDIVAGWAVSYLDDGDAVLIVDETADEKSSADTVGAAHQYKGTRHYDWTMLEVTLDEIPGGHDDGHSVLLARRHRYTRTVVLPVLDPRARPLARLIAIAVTRWRI